MFFGSKFLLKISTSESLIKSNNLLYFFFLKFSNNKEYNGKYRTANILKKIPIILENFDILLNSLKKYN